MSSSTVRQPSPNREKSRWVDVAKLVLFLGIGLLFIYLFLIKLDASQKAAIWQSFTHANFWWVAAVMAISLLSHFVRALRWQLLFGPMDLHPGLGSTFGSVVVAYLANLAFPRLGEVVRCATLRTSSGIPIEKSLGTVVTERCVDIIAFGVVLVIGLLAMYGQAKEWLLDALAEKSHSLPSVGVMVAVGVGVVVIAVGVYLLRRRAKTRRNDGRPEKEPSKLMGILKGGVDGLRSIFHLNTKALVLFVVYSVVIYLLYILGGLILFRAFPETAELGFGAAFVLYLFGSVGMTISQGGLGAYPVLVWQALSLYGIGETVGLAVGWLLWASQQAVVIVVGLGWLVYFALAFKLKAKR